MTVIMIETRTIDEDRGLRCAQCGRDLYRGCVTWWLTRHGEYCSTRCAEEGAQELHTIINSFAERVEVERDDR